MARYNERPKFKVHVNYPDPENLEAYEHRKAKAVAKVLVDMLPPKIIDEIIEKLERKNNNG